MMKTENSNGMNNTTTLVIDMKHMIGRGDLGPSSQKNGIELFGRTERDWLEAISRLARSSTSSWTSDGSGTTNSIFGYINTRN